MVPATGTFRHPGIQVLALIVHLLIQLATTRTRLGACPKHLLLDLSPRKADHRFNSTRQEKYPPTRNYSQRRATKSSSYWHILSRWINPRVNGPHETPSRLAEMSCGNPLGKWGIRFQPIALQDDKNKREGRFFGEHELRLVVSMNRNAQLWSFVARETRDNRLIKFIWKQ